MSLPTYDIDIDFSVLFETVDSQSENIVRNLPRARDALKPGDNPRRYNIILAGLDELIASAFAQRDKVRFKEGLRLIGTFRPVPNTRPPPWKELYTNLLSLTLVTGPMVAAAAIAGDVRRAAFALPDELFGYQAEMLAALIALDRDGIARVLGDLRRGTEERRFSKATAAMAELWAAAGGAIVNRNGDALGIALVEIGKAHHQMVLKGAAAWDKGRNSDFDVHDFLMAPEAALQSIGQAAGLIEVTTISPYFDVEWIRTAV